MSDDLLALKLEKLKALERETARMEALPHLYMHKHYKWSHEFENDFTTKVQVVCAGNQQGKLIEYSEDIPTLHGWKKVRDIRVGDYLFGQDGKPTKVVAIPYDGPDEGYRVTFSDGTAIRAGANHLWVCKTSEQRFRKTSSHYDQWSVLTTKQIVEVAKYAPRAPRARNKVVVPYCQPIEYKTKKLFDPYVLGALLGDGCLRRDGVVFTKPDEFILDILISKYGAKLAKHDPKKCVAARFSKAGAVGTALQSLGVLGTVSNNKFIPEEYLTSSVDQRLALLRGLMDTDGWVNDDGDTTEFNTASSRLADGVVELIYSLGGTCKRTLKKCHYVKDGKRIKAQDSHRLRIKMPEGVNPFLTPVKAKLWRGKIRYRHERVIEKIEPIGRIRGRCFTVDNRSSTFCAGKSYVVSHNSSALLKKVFRIATEPHLWPKMWPNLPKGMLPSQWWYLYPSSEIAAIEYIEKWKPLLPRVPDTDPIYGWKEIKKDSKIIGIAFNSGINIYWKFYSQAVTMLQAGSCYLMALDEEVFTTHIPELQMRTRAVDGYMFFAFTPTIGQRFWTDVVETRTIWPNARVWQPSLYDCMYYVDGTPSHWTKEKVQRALDECISEVERQRRIFGRVLPADVSGLQFASFNTLKNCRNASPIPADWLVYAGIDYGSGASSQAHLSAITFLAINPERTLGRVVRLWRGDKTSTTAEDVVNKFEEMCAGMPSHSIQSAFYDFSARDIGTIAQRRGLPFLQANKGRDHGKSFINSLFKSGCLTLDMWSEDMKVPGLDPTHLETFKVVTEIEQLRENANKTSAKDDAIDSMRYAVSAISWAWEEIRKFSEASAGAPMGNTNGVIKKPVVDERVQRLIDFKRGANPNEGFGVEEELEFWQDQFDQV